MQRWIGRIVLFSTLVMLSACMSSVEWGPNIAVNARATNDRMNDGNDYTGADSQAMLEEARDLKILEEMDKYTQATLTWNRPTTIARVVIRAKELEVFTLEALVDGEWKTLHETKNNLKDSWAYTLPDPVTTTEIRVRIPRKYDTRRVGGAKRRNRVEGGMPSGEKTIYEFEAYGPPIPKEDEQ